MKLEEYIHSPMGKGSSVFMVNDMRRVLDEKFLKVQNRFITVWYLLGDRYLICHVKVPSMSYEKIFYDVILQFDLESIGNHTTINFAETQFFSNCPSFIFTHAYAFNKKGMLCPWTKEKLDSKVFDLQPISRNPYELISYERSIYFAARYLLSSGRNYVSYGKTKAQKINSVSEILSRIKTQSKIMEMYDTEKKKAIIEKKKLEANVKPTKPKVDHKEKGRESSRNHTVSKVKKVGSGTTKSKKVKKL